MTRRAVAALGLLCACASPPRQPTALAVPDAGPARAEVRWQPSADFVDIGGGKPGGADGAEMRCFETGCTVGPWHRLGWSH